MSFWKDHAAPTLHNALGTIIGTAFLAAVTALVVFIKPLRAFANLTILLWVVALIFVGCVTILRCSVNKLRKKLTTTEQNLADAESHLDKAQKDKLARDAAEKAQNAQKLQRKRPFVDRWRNWLW